VTYQPDDYARFSVYCGWDERTKAVFEESKGFRGRNSSMKEKTMTNAWNADQLALGMRGAVGHDYEWMRIAYQIGVNEVHLAQYLDEIDLEEEF
jgi:hypothetical protein